jgi:hypothetical protein
MILRALGSSRLLMVLASLLIAAGCAGPLAKTREVDQPKEAELRANWKSYHTFCLKDYAILFQLKGDKTIQKENDWREITSDGDASRCASFLSLLSPVTELLGENGVSFGYIVYNRNDGVSASIIDPKTIRLFYHVHPKGP